MYGDDGMSLIKEAEEKFDRKKGAKALWITVIWEKYLTFSYYFLYLTLWCYVKMKIIT